MIGYTANTPYMSGNRTDDVYILAQGPGTGTLIPGNVAKIRQNKGSFRHESLPPSSAKLAQAGLNSLHSSNDASFRANNAL